MTEITPAYRARLHNRIKHLRRLIKEDLTILSYLKHEGWDQDALHRALNNAN